MGEKPLYYGVFGNTLAFASELKSLRRLSNCLRDIDPAAIADVLERGYVRGTRSVHPGIRKLSPGSLLTATFAGGPPRLEIIPYWSINQALERASSPSASVDEASATEELEALLRSVVADEMVADVPVGAFLSGGID